MWTIYKLWKTNEHTILKLWTLIKNIIERTHKFPYNILFTFLMDRGRAPNGIGHLTGRGRHRNFDPRQCLRPRPEILDRYISLSCLRWLPTACHERLAYFHWPQWVTWLVTWWVTWSRWPDAGRHIGKFSLWTTLLRFSRSAQISLFSNFTKLGQLFFDNIFFGLTS